MIINPCLNFNDSSIAMTSRKHHVVSNPPPIIRRFIKQLIRTHIKELSKPALLALCEGSLPMTCEFPAQRASNAEEASIWWWLRHYRHIGCRYLRLCMSYCEWICDPPESGKIMMTSSNGNIFRVTGPLCGKFTGHRWIPLTKASDAELWRFLWSMPEQTVE